MQISNELRPLRHRCQTLTSAPESPVGTVMGMNVSLPEDLMDYVKSQVAGGRYSSASEMVRDALRHLKQFEKMREQAHAELAREVELGWAGL